YIDHDVLRKTASPNLLHRAMRDVGKNPTGWSHRWCGRQMAMRIGEGPNLARDWDATESDDSLRSVSEANL
ncbi:MAG TPA: hypothetical protein VH858_04840, partial [Hyphomicrobiales bacterium]